MPYQEFPFETLGLGLNLRDRVDVIESGAAIDALNVVFTERGRVKQRSGYTNFTSSTLTNRAASLEPFYRTGGSQQLLAGCGTRLEAISAAGGVVASATGLTSGTWDFARLGTPNAERAYAGQGTDTLRKWDGASWTAPTATVDGTAGRAMPRAGALCVEATDNRLVASGFSTTTGGPNGATSSPSHVYWSDPGDPETWNSNNYIQFTPGDGERIQAVVSWREFVFVFKETKFFVVYGTSTDAGGNPIFNYRPVDAGVGLASPRAICTSHSGVYFMDRSGVFRTTGGEPELLSSIIEPIWLGSASDFYSGGVLAHGSITNCAMTWHDEKLFVAFPSSSTNDRTLVFDPRYEWWSLYDFPAAALASFRISSQSELVFARATGSNHVDRHNTSQTNDAGVAITSRWRSGWYDYGADEQKVIRETKIWGSGRVFLGLATDFQNNTGDLVLMELSLATGSLWSGSTWGGGTWATSPAVVAKLRRRATRGTVFSTYLYNATLDQSWTCNRLANHLRVTRRPTVLQPDL